MGNIFNYAMGGIVDFLEVYIIFRYMMIFFEDAYVNDRLAYIAYAARLFISYALRFASVSPVISAGISYGSIFFVSLCLYSRFCPDFNSLLSRGLNSRLSPSLNSLLSRGRNSRLSPS